MCRILGIKNFSYNKHIELVENFYKLAHIGKVPPGNKPGHTDGWGIGYYRNSKPVIYKSGGSVIKEKSTFFAHIKNIVSTNILIIHFRKSAWSNTNNTNNSHPFNYNNILFAHNGTIIDYKKLYKYINNPYFNGLDTETFLQFILRNISSGLESAFKKSVSFIIKNNKYTSLTCIFSDGEKLYAFREYTKNSNYYTLYYTENNGSVIISSEPISNKLQWLLLKKSKLFAI
jgi:glutamine amidotransferase